MRVKSRSSVIIWALLCELHVVYWNKNTYRSCPGSSKVTRWHCSKTVTWHVPLKRLRVKFFSLSRHEGRDLVWTSESRNLVAVAEHENGCSDFVDLSSKRARDLVLSAGQRFPWLRTVCKQTLNIMPLFYCVWHLFIKSAVITIRCSQDVYKYWWRKADFMHFKGAVCKFEGLERSWNYNEKNDSVS